MNFYRTCHHLVAGFAQSVEAFPDSPALHVEDQCFTYRELDQLSESLAAAIHGLGDADPKFVGFLAHRSVTAYASVLGILRSGRCYVPLNPKFPIARTAQMIRASGLTTLIVGNEASQSLKELLPILEEEITVVYDDLENIADLKLRHPSKNFVSLREAPHSQLPAIPADTSEDDFAYLLFTSGSTGAPKGVPVSHRNVVSYLNYTLDRYPIDQQDRFSQTFDLTFDLSVHDMFVCWGAGACLYCVPERSTMAPARFINDHAITMWFSVPSVISFMQRMRLLRPKCFPSIRVSLFCGEPLLASSAEVWQAAANHSIVENLYGPTEATIATTQYRWNTRHAQNANFPNGVVPIGKPYAHQQCTAIDSDRVSVKQGAVGELCLAGPQVTAGYLNNENKTREQFVKLNTGDSRTWYRTGDLVHEDEHGCLFYRGRIDSQLQVRGHRVELQEIEHVLRTAGDDTGVAIGWPTDEANTEAIYAFFCDSNELDANKIMLHCRKLLPEYMVPRNVFFVSKIPLNANGKVDRRALGEQVKEIINDKNN